MILKLFVELNEINKTSTNITPCQDTLGTLSNLHNVGYIISRIKIRVGKCSIPSRFDPPTLCCVVLCSYMYSANEKTVPGFNNTMVHSLWKSIKLVFQLMLLKAAMSPEVIKILMCGTSSHGFDPTLPYHTLPYPTLPAFTILYYSSIYYSLTILLCTISLLFLHVQFVFYSLFCHY